MLQIIGWLMCAYLVVKGFELIAMKHQAAYVGGAISFVAAVGFFFLINEAADTASEPWRQMMLEQQVEADADRI